MKKLLVLITVLVFSPVLYGQSSEAALKAAQKTLELMSKDLGTWNTLKDQEKLFHCSVWVYSHDPLVPAILSSADRATTTTILGYQLMECINEVGVSEKLSDLIIKDVAAGCMVLLWPT